MKSSIISIIAAIIVALTLSTVAFAAEDETMNIGSPIWGDAENIYTLNDDGDVVVVPREPAIETAPAIEVDAVSEAIGDAIWTDGVNIYTCDSAGVITVIPYRPAIEVEAAAVEIGTAVMSDGFYTFTFDADGTLLSITVEPEMLIFCENHSAIIGQPTIWVDNHGTELHDIGPAIWADEYDTYVDGGDGATVVYFDRNAVCGHCVPYTAEETADRIGPAIWASPIGTYTSSNTGVIRVYLNEGYICSECGC